MTAEMIRDVGDILLRVACTYVGGLLLALALGVHASAVQDWGWLVAVFAVPAAYAVRWYGIEAMLADAESRRRASGRASG